MDPATPLKTPATSAADKCEAWVGIYAVLSACFSPPTEALLADAKGGTLAAALRNLCEKLSGKSRRTEAALQAFDDLPRKMALDASIGALEDLEVEYTRLFLGPGLAAVPPYESVYVDRESTDELGPLWGEASFAVREAYAEAGVAPLHGAEPPDNLAAELEFMALLWESEAAALAEGDVERARRAERSRASFLADHLSRWGPSMAERTAQETRQPLYEAAGLLLQAILGSDA